MCLICDLINGKIYVIKQCRRRSDDFWPINKWSSLFIKIHLFYVYFSVAAIYTQYFEINAAPTGHYSFWWLRGMGGDLFVPKNTSPSTILTESKLPSCVFSYAQGELLCSLNVHHIFSLSLARCLSLNLLLWKYWMDFHQRPKHYLC